MSKDLVGVGRYALARRESAAADFGSATVKTAAGAGVLYWVSGPLPFVDEPGTVVLALVVGGAVWAKGRLFPGKG